MHEKFYVARQNGTFVGMCAVDQVDKYYKLGPFIVLSQYRGRGYGTQLFAHVMKELEGETLFVGSSNPTIRKIIEKHGFEPIQRKDIPRCSKVYFLKYMLKILSLSFLLDAFKKWMIKRRGKYSTYVRWGD
jgi:N-acetylglutamate synthase-like GNAT family acetyltransferase